MIMNLYILKLKNNKYYVGTTNKNIYERLQEHINGNGSKWTKLHKVISLEKSIENCDKFDEDKWTKIYMNKYGIENVRGGTYCKLELDNNSINLITKEVSHANNKCLYCNKFGHYINNCPNKKNTINSKYYSKNLNYLNMSCDYDSESDYESDSDEEWEESPHQNVGARDGTIYDSELGYIRPKKTYSSNLKCFRCGRNGHFSKNCFARKHIKGYFLKTSRF